MRCENHLISKAATVLALLCLNFSSGEAAAQVKDKVEIELAAVCVDGLCGYVNSQGEWHIPPKFAAADPFSEEGLAWVTVNEGSARAEKNARRNQDRPPGNLFAVYEGQSLKNSPAHSPAPVEPKVPATPYNGKVGLINTRGEFVVQPVFLMEGRPFADNGLAIVRISETGKWGFIDNKGQWAVEPQFDQIYPFLDQGMAKARKNGKWGYINALGQWVIEPKFDRIDSFPNSGLGKAQKNGKWGLIDGSGQWVGEPEFDYIAPFSDQGLASAAINRKFGYIDTGGQWVIKPQFDNMLGGFSQNGLGAVCIDQKWGFINTSGQWLINPVFESVDAFSNAGLAIVNKDGKCGLINTQGQWVVEPVFDRMESFSDDGLARIILNGKYGFIDTQGRLAVEPIFDYVRHFNGKKLTSAEMNGKWGFINTSGQWVVEPEFDIIWARDPGMDSLFDYSNNKLVAVWVNGKAGYINAEAKGRRRWVIEPKFDGAKPFRGNMAQIQENGKYGYINTAGQVIIKPEFDYMFDFSFDGRARVRKSGKWGMIDISGQWLIKAAFDELGLVSDQELVAASVNRKWGVINTKGQWVIEPKFDYRLSLPKSGNLAFTYLKDGGKAYQFIPCIIDTGSGVYRTGLNDKLEEPYFRWELKEGRGSLFNRQGDKVLSIERICGVEVAKNKPGEIVWPQRSLTQICEDHEKRSKPMIPDSGNGQLDWGI